MRKPTQERIRDLLHQYEDGLTTLEVARYIMLDASNTKRALMAMPDVYIDRWVHRSGSGRAPWREVWCAAQIPEDCPPPESTAHDTNRNNRQSKTYAPVQALQ
jgi:hypothetical protein